MTYFLRATCVIMAGLFILFAICACTPMNPKEQAENTTSEESNPVSSDTSGTSENVKPTSTKAYRVCKMEHVSYLGIDDNNTAHVYFSSGPNEYIGHIIATDVTRLIYKTDDKPTFMEFVKHSRSQSTDYFSGELEILILVFKSNHKITTSEAEFLSKNGINYMWERAS